MKRLFGLFALAAVATLFALATPLSPALAQIGADSKEPVAVEADSMEVLQDRQLAIFTGNVVVIQGTMRLQTDKLVISYDNSDSNKDSSVDQGSIRQIDAYGNVVVVSATETAQGNEGVYDVVRGFITLTGNVVLTRGQNIIRGNSLVMDLNTGQSRVQGGAGTGRIKGIFAPSQN